MTFTKKPAAEKTLLRKLRNGDFEAFEQLYNRYKERLAGNFIRLLHSDELAQDALQNLFLKIWETRRTIDPGQSFRAFLLKIAENQVIDIYRKAARHKLLRQQLLAGQDNAYTHIEERLNKEETIHIVRQVIAQLPEQQKKVYTLHKLEGKSYKEISRLLNISPSTINKHIHYAHRFVKTRLLKSPLSFIALILALS